jgi:hypothetical protein
MPVAGNAALLDSIDCSTVRCELTHGAGRHSIQNDICPVIARPGFWAEAIPLCSSARRFADAHDRHPVISSHVKLPRELDVPASKVTGCLDSIPFSCHWSCATGRHDEGMAHTKVRGRDLAREPAWHGPQADASRHEVQYHRLAYRPSAVPSGRPRSRRLSSFAMPPRGSHSR